MGLEAPDGSAWEILGVRYDTNPRYQLTENDWDLVRLWQAFQGSGMAPGHLPEAGGMGDQAALMIDAFSVMSAAEHELKPEGNP